MVRPAPGSHAGFQHTPGHILSLGVRWSQAVVSVLGGPVKFISVIGIVNRVLGLVPTGVDVSE
jgi:hypothetical protein